MCIIVLQCFLVSVIEFWCRQFASIFKIECGFYSNLDAVLEEEGRCQNYTNTIQSIDQSSILFFKPNWKKYQKNRNIY